MATAKLSEIIRLMVGREIKDIYPRVPHTLGEVVLDVKGLAGQTKPRSVSFSLRAGEIFGIAGLIGAGRTETLRICFGLESLKAGQVLVFQQQKTKATPSARLAEGVGLLSENRKEEGLMLGLSLADNLTITRFEPAAHFGFIQGRRQRQCAAEWMKRLDVRAQSPTQTVGELSGGNQQKVAVGRLLHHDARIFLLDEPTRGIDVGSKAQIYALMGDLAAQGKAILFVSSYLPELLGMCDTIGVMSRGVLSDVRSAADWTEHTIISAAIGAGF
jgi:ribose transport system ATP-binding protein